MWPRRSVQKAPSSLAAQKSAGSGSAGLSFTIATASAWSWSFLSSDQRILPSWPIRLVADGELVLAVAVHVVGVAVVAGIAGDIPQRFQLVVVGADAAVAVLEDDVARPPVAAQVEEVERVAQDALVFVDADRPRACRGGESGVLILRLTLPVAPSAMTSSKSRQ